MVEQKLSFSAHSKLPSEIPGRGGASLVHLSSTDEVHTLLLFFGASREQQLDDFWIVKIDRKTFKVTEAQELVLKERDNLTTRNSMAAVSHGGKVILFGGQDSEKGILYNEIYSIDTNQGYKIQHHSYGEGEIAPAPRNSHTMVSDGQGSAYMFGGANEEGPRRDLFKLDLDTMRFSNIKIQDESKIKVPYLEMHTSHMYNNGKNLLILGGRGMFPGQ